MTTLFPEQKIRKYCNKISVFLSAVPVFIVIIIEYIASGSETSFHSKAIMHTIYLHDTGAICVT